MHQKRHRAIQNEFNQQGENNEEEQGSHPKEFRRKPNSFAAASNFAGFEPPVARQSTSKPSSSTSVHDLLDDCAEMSDLHPSSSQHSSSIDLLSLPLSSPSTSIIPSTSPVDSADSSLSYCAFGDLANGVSGIVSPAPITFSAIHQLDSNQPTSSWSLAPTSSSSMSDAGSDSLLSSASSHVSSGSTILSSDSTASPEFRKTRAYRFDGSNPQRLPFSPFHNRELGGYHLESLQRRQSLSLQQSSFPSSSASPVASPLPPAPPRKSSSGHFFSSPNSH